MNPRVAKLTLPELIEWLSSVGSNAELAHCIASHLQLALGQIDSRIEEWLPVLPTPGGGDSDPGKPGENEAVRLTVLASCRRTGNKGKKGVGERVLSMLRETCQFGELSLVGYALICRELTSPEKCDRNRRADVCKTRVAIRKLGADLEGPNDGAYGPLSTVDGRATDLSLAIAVTREAERAWQDGSLTAEAAASEADRALKLDPWCHQARTLHLAIALAAGQPAKRIVKALRQVHSRRVVVFERIGRLLKMLRAEAWRPHRETIRERLVTYSDEGARLVTLGLFAEIKFQNHLTQTAEETAFRELCETVLGYRRDPDAVKDEVIGKVYERPITAALAASLAAVVRKRLACHRINVCEETTRSIALRHIARYIVTMLPLHKIKDLPHLRRRLIISCWHPTYVSALADHLSESENTVLLVFKKWKFIREFELESGEAPTDQDIKENVPGVAEHMANIERVEAALGEAVKSISVGFDMDPTLISEEILPNNDMEIPGVPPALIVQAQEVLRGAPVDDQVLLDKWLNLNGGLRRDGHLPTASTVKRLLRLRSWDRAERLASLIRTLDQITYCDDSGPTPPNVA